jgi:TolB protein
VKPDGSALTQLTDSAGGNLSPSWSTDAKHILFVSTRDGNSEIYMMDPDGAHQVNLSRDSHSDGMPAWIPPDKIAFVSDRQGRERIFVMNADGSKIQAFPQSSIDSTTSMLCVAWYQDAQIFLTTE